MACDIYRWCVSRMSAVPGAPCPGLRVVPLLALLAWATSGCALLQPATPPASAVCTEQDREIVRLQQTLAERDAEIQSLHDQQTVQAEALTQTSGEVARAAVKLRRLATQADAASDLAEVEVALQALWAETHRPRAAAQLVQAQRILDAGAAAFVQGDYGVAVELAAQSQAMIDMVNGRRRPESAARNALEVAFKVPVMMCTRIDSNLRAQPGRTAPGLGVLQKGTPLQVHAYRGEWLRVRTEDGRAGWVFGPLLEAPYPGTE